MLHLKFWRSLLAITAILGTLAWAGDSIAADKSLKIVVASAPNTNDVLPAARSLVGKVEVI